MRGFLDRTTHPVPTNLGHFLAQFLDTKLD